jgi:putative Ca2+/H+ antiporter (TMEM165/GDT1 family)
LSDFSLAAFGASLLLIFLAEMGDKTQFMAMSLATKNKAYSVLLAIFLATLGNFAIVIVVGELLTTVLPLDIISLAASISFIGFGLWMLREEKSEEKTKKASRFGVVGTVAIAFFIAEFGDKTQLATMSLAVQYESPISVLLGATLAMVVADGIGIVVGVILGKHIPQRAIKWFSAVIFVIFGIVGVYEVLSVKVGMVYTFLTLVLLAVFSASAMIIIAKKQKSKKALETETRKKNASKTNLS